MADQDDYDMVSGQEESELEEELGLEEEEEEQDEEDMEGDMEEDGDEDVASREGEREGLADEATLDNEGGPPTRRQNPLARLLSAVDPNNLIAAVLQRVDQARRFLRPSRRLSQVRNVGVGLGKRTLRLARKAFRPILIVYVLNKARNICIEGQDTIVKMSKLPENEQVDFYYSKLLGKDWQQQMKQDLLDAVKDVQDGYVTEEVKREKLLMSAAIQRRWEVDEWDKMRMRNYYYGLHGLGNEYFNIEDALCNPYFVQARGWNAPAMNWIGENRIYPGDIKPEDVDPRELALTLIEQRTNTKLDPSARRVLLERESLSHIDDVLQAPLLKGLLDEEDMAALLEKNPPPAQLER